MDGGGEGGGGDSQGSKGNCQGNATPGEKLEISGESPPDPQQTLTLGSYLLMKTMAAQEGGQSLKSAMGSGGDA